MLKHNDNTTKSFNVSATSLSVSQNYFADPTKLFSDLVKFLDTSAKFFFHIIFISYAIFQNMTEVLFIRTRARDDSIQTVQFNFVTTDFFLNS